MRDTPWHARPRAPEPSPATQPAPKQTTFRRLVLVNQELAQHNTKVRLASFPPAARGPRSRARPTLTTTLLSCPQLRRDLADARRRAAVAANAEAQAGIAVAMHRERQAEAARLRRGLLVREKKTRARFRSRSESKFGHLIALSRKIRLRLTTRLLSSPVSSRARRPA